MIPSVLRLPNGQTVTVSPVFGGVSFKPNHLNTHTTAIQPGWTIVLQTEDDENSTGRASGRWEELAAKLPAGSRDSFPSKKQYIHPYKRPTRADDYLFLSSISNPSSADFQPATSPTREIAMMLWTTLYWYFQQPEPDLHLRTSESALTAADGRPLGDWRINVRREGVFRGRNLLQKLERMGLIACEDSCVGASYDERAGEGWQDMFVSRRSFWQLDPRIFLFTLSPAPHSPFASGSPYPSRPASPAHNGPGVLSLPSPAGDVHHAEAMAVAATSQGIWSPSTASELLGAASHLPTYFPPPPLQFTMTDGVRHPIRPKPPRQGETFYMRFIPSLAQYLSFRTVSLSPRPQSLAAPSSPTYPTFLPPNSSLLDPHAAPPPPSPSAHTSDAEFLHKWMNEPRVARFWGEGGPRAHQESFLRRGLQSRHSFPAIGCWDGRPFGYVEIYWVREDRLGRYLDGGADIWDRGLHCLVGEQEFRGQHRFRVWMSALVHYCFLADNRTQNVYLEPRVDNEKFINYLQDIGFFKEREVAFPHKQAAVMRITRDAWEAPAL